MDNLVQLTHKVKQKLNILMQFKQFLTHHLILEANPEKRKAYLKNKYGEKLKSLLSFYNKNPESVDDVIHKIVTQIDPTSGDYSEWITKSLLAKFLPTDNIPVYKTVLDIFDRFFTEDWYKVYDDLEDYHKYKRFFKKAGEEKNNPNTVKLADINQIKDFDDLYSKLSIISHYINQDKDKAELKEAEKDAEKVYVSDNYYIIVPKTQEASCIYGKGTRWCTASTGSYNYFNQYNKQGPLYIIINRKTDEKHQFHFQTGQYMDVEDHSVDVVEFAKENTELVKPLVKLALENDNVDFPILIDTDGTVEVLLTYKNTEKSNVLHKAIRSNAYIAYKIGLKEPEEVQSVQKLFTFKDNTVHIHTMNSEWGDFADFVGKAERDTAREYLRDESYSDYDANCDYDDSYWEWLNVDSQELVKLYIKNVYEIKVETLEDAIDIIEEKNDTYIKDMLTNSYNRVYNDDVVSQYYKRALACVMNAVGNDHYWLNDNIVLVKSIKQMDEIFTMLKEAEDEGMPPSRASSFMDSWRCVLEETDQLSEPDFDRVQGDPDIKTYQSAFNEDFSYNLDIPDAVDKLALQGQIELDLSHTSINKNMSLFDQEVNKILHEAQFGKGGIANQSGTTAAMNPNVQPAASPNAQPKFAGKPQFTGVAGASQTPPPSTSAQGSNVNPNANPNTNPNAQPDENVEFDSLMQMQQKDPNAFNKQSALLTKDPEKFSRFIAYLSQPTGKM